MTLPWLQYIDNSDYISLQCDNIMRLPWLQNNIYCIFMLYL